MTYRLTERDITYQIVDYLHLLGAWVFKVRGALGQMPGTPDILFCWQGRFGAIEVKGPKGKLSEAQKGQLELIKQAGGLAIVAYDLNDVIKALTGRDEWMQIIHYIGEGDYA